MIGPRAHAGALPVRILAVLVVRDGLLVPDLALELDRDAIKLNEVIRRLEGSGLVERRRDAHNRRRIVVWLTEAGRALATSVEPPVSDEG